MESLSSAIDMLLDSRLGNFLGIIGLVAAVYMWRYPRSSADLAWVTEGSLLLGYDGEELPKEITVTYAGTPIPRLSRTTVAIWNNGHVTLLGTALVSEDPLRIVVGEGAQVLDARVIGHTRAVNKVCVGTPQGNTVPLTFSFLDTKDCAVIEILHTSAESMAFVEGTIQGMPKGISNKGRASIHSQWHKALLPFWRKVELLPVLAFSSVILIILPSLTRTLEAGLPFRGLFGLTPTGMTVLLVAMGVAIALGLFLNLVMGREARVPYKKLIRAPMPSAVGHL